MQQGQRVIDLLAPNGHRLMVQEALEVLDRLGCKPHQHRQLADPLVARSRRGLLGRVMFYFFQLLARLACYFYGSPEKQQGHNAQTQLLRLPPEIVFHVLGFLSARDLALLRLSCSDLALHAGDDRLWRRLCERDWNVAENMLVEYLGMDWSWVYRSKVVIRGSECAGQVGTRISGECVRWEGQWTESGLEGYGLYVGHGHVIEGQWRSGLLVFGRVSYRPRVSLRNGDFCVGQWAGSWETGAGVCFYAERKHPDKQRVNCHHEADGNVGCSMGYKYEGLWQNGLHHGQGTFYWRNGATWQGNFDDGKPTGQGQHYCPATGEITPDVCWNSRFDCCRSCPDALTDFTAQLGK